MNGKGRNFSLVYLLICQTKTGEEKCFRGEGCVEAFLDYLLEFKHNSTVIAHNFKGYDGFPVLKVLLDHLLVPDVIYAGGKLLSVTLRKEKIRFVDSLNFLVMPLSSFPKAFDLRLDEASERLSKGFFPFLFNTAANEGYVGPLPPRETFLPSGFGVKKLAAFEVWYTRMAADPDYVFDLQAKMEAYCSMDVTILRMGCQAFSKEFEQVMQVAPFKHAITMSSACNGVYRAFFMPPHTLPLVPTAGYIPYAKQSRMALVWLALEGRHLGRPLQHAGNSGERRLVGVRGPVDGYDAETGTAYEFCGCLWHGCARCFDPDLKNPVNGVPMGVLNAKTQSKHRAIRDAGHALVVLWECQWREILEEDTEARRLNASEFPERLNARDAFYGRRTGCVQVYCQVPRPPIGSDPSLVDRIRYMDYVSLYPHVNKNYNDPDVCPYPMGHPVLLTATDVDFPVEGEHCLDEYFGLVKCDVLPPRDLYIPVLPYRTAGHLTFPLCCTCVERHRQGYCVHEDEADRFLHGTWTTEEVKVALSRGYRMRKVYEIWHFAETSRTLFRDYINMFQKLKQEASGWPPGCDTIEQRLAFLRAYEEHEGIRLDYDLVVFNPQKRQTAKYSLNVLWGRLGMADNKLQLVIVTTAQQWYALATSDGIEIMGVLLFGDDFLQVFFRYRENFRDEQKRSAASSSVYVAIYTTASARLKLLYAMEKCGRNLLYFDTDSLLFKQLAGQPMPVKTGAFFGELKDEILPTHTILDYVSAGAKNYAYSLYEFDAPPEKPLQTVTKVRGLRLDAATSEKVNHDSMVKMMLELVERMMVRRGEEEEDEYDSERLEVEVPNDLPDKMTRLCDELAIRVEYPHFIPRDKTTYTLRSVRMEKIYKAVIRKRFSAVCEMGGPKKDPNEPHKTIPSQTNPFDTTVWLPSSLLLRNEKLFLQGTSPRRGSARQLPRLDHRRGGAGRGLPYPTLTLPYPK